VNAPEAILLGAVEGLTEFLPISSTGHLTVLEKILGHKIDDPDITAFTAIIQSGAVFATLLFFRRDLWRMLTALIRGVLTPGERANPDYRFAWAIVIGSIPIGIVGLLFQDAIETTLRNLWFVGGALIAFSFVMLFADRTARQERDEPSVTWRDTLIIGVAQCLAVVPGVSRSGATMSAGLLRGLDRVTATKMAFFLSIPALAGATVLQAVTKFGDIADGVGWSATLIATFTSFVVAYVAVAWLLRFVAHHGYTVFIVYRVSVGAVLLVLLATGAIAAT
jgi:undecaprenyl-diphosphatase